MKKAGLICTLATGAFCICAIAVLLPKIGVPDLFITFTRNPDTGAVPLRFFNAGSGDVRLDVAGIEHFLFQPAEGGDRFLLYLRNKPFTGNAAETARRIGLIKTLPPKESYQVGDLRSVIARLPGNTRLSLTAVYAAAGAQGAQPNPGNAWAGEVKSMPLFFREENR